jgi:hypothetical protein
MPTARFAAAYRSNRWRVLSQAVVKAEPTCWLQLPGCSYRSTQADHILPAHQRPDLFFARSNLRGSCRSCNSARGDLPVSQLPALRAKLSARPMTRQQALAALRFRRHRQKAPALRIFDGPKSVAAEPPPLISCNEKPTPTTDLG